MLFKKKIRGTHLLLFTFIFIIKLTVLRIVLFENYNVFTTLRSELLYIFSALLIIELIFTKGKIIAYLIFDFLITAVFFSVIVYTAYFGTLPSHYDLSQLDQVGAVSDSITLLIKPQYFLFFLDFIFLIPLLLLIKKKDIHLFSLKYRSVGILLAVCLIGLVLNFSVYKNERIIDTMAAAESNGIFNYQILQYFQDAQTASTVRNFTNAEIQDIKGTVVLGDGDRYFGEAEGKNLIMIQMESLQDFILHSSIDGQEITPNLNELADQSYYYTNVFQQIGAGNTSDAEFMANTSLYPAGLQATSKAYGDREIPSLPRLLNEKGYETATFHAGEVTFWNRIEMYPALGFGRYYDREYFGDEDVVGSFGPSDDILYKGTMDVIEGYVERDENFYTHIISLTNHSPFTMPDEKIGIDLPSKLQDSFFGNYLEASHYADSALGRFIEELKEKGIWENTLFVIYGDHSGLHGKLLKKEDTALISEEIGHHYSRVDRFNVPFIIHDPSAQKGERIDQVGGQIDMMPTVANFLGLQLDDHIHFGQDLSNTETNLFGMRYYLPTGTFFNNEVLYVASAEEEKKPAAYDLETTEFIPLKEEFKKYMNRMFDLYELNDAYLNSLPQRGI
ncbi:LTA synthase family protein [Rossellomorea vietnamensis]|uniref:LTA synthase family protein n=1 Tax=Rossellomorea TaxID=2837508 RepID=UPI0016539DE1|nr:LTA synthase family protein [Rossellomorea aquimaris]